MSKQSQANSAKRAGKSKKTSSQESQPDPTILDWFKSLVRLNPIPIPSSEESAASPSKPAQKASDRSPTPSLELPKFEFAFSVPMLRAPLGFILALGAQWALEARAGSAGFNAALYVFGAVLVAWGALAGDFGLPARPSSAERDWAVGLRARYLAAGVVLALFAFLLAYGNRFRPVMLAMWAGAAAFSLAGLWQEAPTPRQLWAGFVDWLKDPGVRLSVSGWGILLVLGLLVTAYFRFSRLDAIPYEMWSDQAEKLLDLNDILNGQYSIFFPRNSGREALQFYLATLTSKALGTGLTFLTLKIGTALAGWLTLPLLYLFAKEIGGRKVGLLAMILAGLAFWPNITSRAGLRMPLNEMFVAATLFLLLRSIRLRSANGLLLTGLVMGLGLQGYSGVRVLPVVVALGGLFYLVIGRTGGHRRAFVLAFAGLVLMSLIGALPLLRVAVDRPDLVFYRTLTRVGTVEQPYPANPVLILLNNMWDALGMFSWDTGEIWIVTVPHRPAMDWVSGAFFHIGVALVLVRFLRQRRWQDALLLTSLPVLLLPSALALAFPNENPAPNRVTGAIVPAFTLAGLGMVAAGEWIRERLRLARSRLVAGVVLTGLLTLVAMANYHLVFTVYADQQRTGAWNHSEAGRIVSGFAESIGSFETAHMVPFVHWYDGRLISIEAGYPIKDISVLPENLATLELDASQYHLFLIKPVDPEAQPEAAAYLQAVTDFRSRYPRGSLTHYDAAVEGRDILLFLVPPAEGASVTTPE